MDLFLPDSRGRQIHLKCWYRAIWHGKENLIFTIMKTSYLTEICVRSNFKVCALNTYI